jgi:hypothetical protein
VTFRPTSFNPSPMSADTRDEAKAIAPLVNRLLSTSDWRKFPRIGPVRRKLRRVLIVAGYPMTTGQLARRIYPPPFKRWHADYVRRAVPMVAERIGQVRSAGLPVLWRLKVPFLRTVLFACNELLSLFNEANCN